MGDSKQTYEHQVLDDSGKPYESEEDIRNTEILIDGALRANKNFVHSYASASNGRVRGNFIASDFYSKAGNLSVTGNIRGNYGVVGGGGEATIDVGERATAYAGVDYAKITAKHVYGVPKTRALF